MQLRKYPGTVCLLPCSRGFDWAVRSISAVTRIWVTRSGCAATLGVRSENFSLAWGKARTPNTNQVGDTVSGEALPVADPRLETVEFYKVSNLKDAVREVVEETPPPPWRGVPPPRVQRLSDC